MDITWRIEGTQWVVETGAITSANWRAFATQGNHRADQYGTVGFDVDPEAPGFVPLEQVTEETVIEWVKAQLDVEAIEGGLAGQLDALVAPTTAEGLPWAELPE